LLEAWLCSGLSLLGHGSAFKRIRRSSAQTSGVLNSHFQKIGTSDAFGAFSNLARWKIFLSLTSLTVAGYVDRKSIKPLGALQPVDLLSLDIIPLKISSTV